MREMVFEIILKLNLRFLLKKFQGNRGEEITECLVVAAVEGFKPPFIRLTATNPVSLLPIATLSIWSPLAKQATK